MWLGQHATIMDRGMGIEEGESRDSHIGKRAYIVSGIAGNEGVDQRAVLEAQLTHTPSIAVQAGIKQTNSIHKKIQQTH